MRKFLSHYLLAFSIVVCSTSFAQDINNDWELFDDGGIAASKNIIKLNIISIINGDFALTYERAFSDKFGLEGGLGLLLPYYLPELPLWGTIKDGWDIQDPDLGYSFLIFPKVYFGERFDNGQFIGVQFRRRNYRQNNESIIYDDVTLNFGAQTRFNAYVFSINAGIGTRFTNLGETNPLGEERSKLSFPISVKIGRKIKKRNQ